MPSCLPYYVASTTLLPFAGAFLESQSMLICALTKLVCTDVCFAKFTHADVHSKQGARIKKSMQVVEKLPKTPSLGLQPGTRAWLLSTQATHHDVISAVAAASHSLPLAAIAWRCRASKDFFLQLVAVLRSMHVYDGEIWRFGFFWKDPRCIAEWLAANKAVLLQHIGVPFHCDFLQVRLPHSSTALSCMHACHA
jgi:hypothetical protein